MENLVATLFLASFVCLIIGLVRPNSFKGLFKGKELNRKSILKIFGTATAVLFVFTLFLAPPAEKLSNDTKQSTATTSKITDQNSASPSAGDLEKTQSQTAPAATGTEEVIDNGSGIVADAPVNNKLADNSISGRATISAEKNTPPATAPVKTNDPAPTIPVTAKPNSQYVFYSVTDVVDGDTIKVNIGGTITTLRLIGIDTPETVDPRKPVQCFGKEASNKAKELLSGQKVRLEKDPSQGELDKYGRTLAYVYRVDGLFYNKYMIAQGYAHEYTYDTPYKYQAEFKAAQKTAQDNQLGLWSPSTCNGDTTQAAVSSVPSANTSATADSTPSGKFYTSSYSTSKYYYPADCSGWQSLTPKYLKAFDSLAALLAAYPSRTLSPQCQKE
ncbi:MAG: thermonuclease family protein [Patescibacteria group bacterium]|nr:thermonuclease family protein [Patescibacteria group bacterium]